MSEHDLQEEIVFLDSELIEDDVDAPMGTLINAPVQNIAEHNTAVSDVQSTAETAPKQPIAAENADDNANAAAETPALQPADGPAAAADTQAEALSDTAEEKPQPVPSQKERLNEKQAQRIDEYSASVTAIGSDEKVTFAEFAPLDSKKKEEKTAPRKKAEPQPDVWAAAPLTRKKSAKTDGSDAAVKTKAAEDEKVAKKADTVSTAKTKKTAPVKDDAVSEKKAPAKKTAAAKPAPVKEEKPALPKKEDKGETVLLAGDESIPHGKFVIKKTDKGNFVYKLYSFNHRVVAIGAEAYASLATCKTGINSVINNAASANIEDQTLRNWEEQKFPKWQIFKDKKGEIRLRLCASNGNIVATTNDGYLSKDAAKNGIDAIGRAANGASIVRNDDLW